MKRLLTVTIAVSCFLVVGAANAGPPPALVKKIAREIGLNNEQIRKVEELIYQAEQEKLDLRHELEKGQLDLGRMMAADQPSESAVFGQIDKLGALQVKQRKNRVGLMLKIRALMTKEQWEKLEILLVDRKGPGRGKELGRGFRGGPPEQPSAPVPPSSPHP